MAENIMLNQIKAFEERFKLIKDPYKQVDALNEFCWLYTDSMIYTELCREKALLCQDILKTIHYPKGVAYNISCFCYYSWAKAKYEDTRRYGLQAIELFTQLGDEEGKVFALTVIAYSLIGVGNFDEAFKCAYEAIRLCETLPSSVSKGWAYYGLAILYYETKDYEAALKLHYRSDKVLKDINYVYGIARGLSFIGSIRIAQNRFEEAEKHIREAIPLYREVGHNIGLSRALNDLGVVYRKTGNYKEAEKYLDESYQIRESVGHTQGMITTSYELGELMIADNHPKEALKWLEIALKLAKETNTRSKEFQVHKAMANAYKLSGDEAKAFAHLEQFIAVYETVAGQETAQRLKQLETRMATEKAEREAELERLKNVELKEAHDIISLKNKEIVDSINYAWRIQSALLNADRLMKENLSDYFVFFKPKDIVSGDFYWARKEGDRFYIAVCDSTGHGVPGAFMSILNATYLNEAISAGINEPNEVFNHVRHRLVENISQDGQQDGMDGILLCIQNKKISYVAAYNSPLLVKGNILEELPMDKMPVGKGEKDIPFTLRTAEHKKGDMLYLYTDGYADQFGGPNGKKFKYKPLEKLLHEISELPVDEQKSVLENKFTEWKGDLEQVDDVLILGIRL
jgi:serine phosphatase RsbU (regulator of sigma subunit)